MQDMTTTIAELKNIVKHFIEEREWQQYHTPKNLSMSIAIVLLVWLTVYRWPLLLCILGGYIGSNIGMYGYRCLKTGFSANRDS